jgi:sterol desaturase/sphingolipid hydroxylase (fatty acid hydroxylase superfamily)
MVPVIIVCAALIMIVCERAWPGRAWPKVHGWAGRALTVSAAQALIVLGFGASFDAWISEHRLFSLGKGAHAALLGYVAVTFVFYVWHRARHENRWLWRYVHQFHHSPQRIEVITSFYKHPLELVLNSVLTGLTLYVLCGLGVREASLALTLCGVAELFYHWNVRTPRWLGYFIQRPEMHCEHHREGVHRSNYGDLPLWDWLFSSYHNPEHFTGRCGFGENERRVHDLLVGKEVSR